MEDDIFAPMELVFTHELEALKAKLEAVTAERDSLLAQMRRTQQPITYSSGQYNMPEWLRDLKVYI